MIFITNDFLRNLLKIVIDFLDATGTPDGNIIPEIYS